MTQITKASLLVRVEALEKSLKHEAGERKQVTVLFCDIADSRALAERIGAEAMYGHAVVPARGTIGAHPAGPPAG